jgi:hypothetical protein
MGYFKQNSFAKSVSCWYNPKTDILSNYKVDKDYIYFSSQHEFSVYQQIRGLIKYMGKPYRLYNQEVIVIKPPSNQLGLLSWKIDFVVKTQLGDVVAYIEAKGGWICQNPLFQSEFWQKLHMMDAFYPGDFKKLYVVGDDTLCKFQSSPVKIFSIHEFARQFREDCG